MKSPPGARRRFSVRGVSNAAIGALAILTLAAVLGLLWTSALLQETSGRLIRDTSSMERASEIELELLSHQRMANLALRTREPGAIAARDQLEREILALLEGPERFASGGREIRLMREATADVHEYLEERRRLEGRELAPWEVVQLARPSLSDAVNSLESLRELNEREVRATHQRAQRTAELFVAISLGAGAAALALLILFARGVRRFFLRPVLGIRAAIEQFRGGDGRVRAPPEGPHELREIAGAFNEMSERLARQREEQLAFLASVAHDLRNPLHGLKVGLQTLQLEGVPAERRERTLEMFRRQLDHLTRMVGDILDASRIEAGEFELDFAEVDVCEMARSVVHLYAPVSDDHEIELGVPSSPVIVSGDRLRLEQVLGNLVSNAIKYSPEGGPVEVAVRKEADVAVFEVSDRGVGIAPEEIEEVFQTFRRSSSASRAAAGAGAGLGLSVVRRLVTAHGGEIQVASAPGFGSTFRVRLPLAARAPPGAEPGDQPSST